MTPELIYPRQVAMSDRYTYWEVAPGVYNVSKGEPPKNEAGYRSLEAIVRLKNDTWPLRSY